MKKYFSFLALIICTILFSCNQELKQSETSSSDIQLAESKQESSQSAPSSSQEQIPINVAQPVADSGLTPLPLKKVIRQDWEKKIIKTAFITAEVPDFKKYTEQVHQAVTQYGGYIAQEDQNLSQQKSETVMSVKVPVLQFESLLNQLHGKDVKIQERKIQTEDVTAQITDTRARLEAKKQMRLKYLEFLQQSKNMADVLQVQNEINNIQEEIESATGRVNLLSQQSAYSTINLTFFQPLAGFKPVDETPGFFTRVSHAFSTGAGWISELLVGLISVWPLILIVFGIYFGWKKMTSPNIIGKTNRSLF